MTQLLTGSGCRDCKQPSKALLKNTLVDDALRVDPDKSESGIVIFKLGGTAG